MCKGAHTLSVTGNNVKALEVLEGLLAQRRWRRGRRGRWHERRALILMKGKTEEERRIALQAVIEGLEDPDTHLSTRLFCLRRASMTNFAFATVFRPRLERRLTTLEKRLNIPEEERHTSAAVLEKAEELTIQGERIREPTADLHLDAQGRPITIRPAGQTIIDVRASSLDVQNGTPNDAELVRDV
jgi:fanconi-associated nuclease 1